MILVSALCIIIRPLWPLEANLSRNLRRYLPRYRMMIQSNECFKRGKEKETRNTEVGGVIDFGQTT